MSRSSMTLSIATWIRSARSGSSLIATTPRWLRGISPKWIVSGSPSRRPSATRIGSTSPMRSATLVSGVASFSLYRSSRCRHATGRASPSSAARRRDSTVIGLERVLPELGAVDDRRPLVEQPDEAAQQAGLALPALAEEDDVVAGEQGALELRDDGLAEAVEPGPRVACPRARAASRLCADLGAHGPGLVARMPAARRWW